MLLVDDDPDVRSVLRRVLESEGYRVDEAGDGRTATELYREHTPEVVITDIFMPEKDGLEVVRELRLLAPDAKIIAISGGGDNVETRMLGAATLFGAQRTLFKPIRPRELLSAVEELLEPPGNAPVTR